MRTLPTPDSPPSAIPPYFGGIRVALRRIAFFGSVLLCNLLASFWFWDLFTRTHPHRGHFVLLAVFFLLNGLLTLGAFHAFFGCLSMLASDRRSLRVTRLAEGAAGPLAKRFAVVMPVYNENAAKVCARIEAIYESLRRTGHLHSFDFFILSDTRDIDLWIIEETAWANLCRKLNALGRIYYRRRKINENRKAGNIGDFVRNWGGSYEGMLVLDADSLMDGADIVKLARVMEVYPQVGILQTAPRLIRGTSVFTRLQQFAMRLYGPFFIRGLNFWQMGKGSYWGHNAMIRVRPFSEFCELPALPGKEPFGGRILSHDFVEAALMVSQGWEVWLAWDITGSYEEAPPTLIDHLKRDRRWAQGNLQHLWLIFARKLPFTTRMHLFMGIMAYLASPIWFAFLAQSTWLAWDWKSSGLSRIDLEGFAGQWFGISPQFQSLILMAAVLALLFLPKILALLVALLSPSLRASFGGGFRLVSGVIFEMFLSMLLAPVVMVAHTLIVLDIAMGRAVGWNTQSREADGTAWSEAIRFHAPQILLGAVWTAEALHIGWVFAAWMSPILTGLVLSIPISVWTSRSRYGRALARAGILATPEELAPPEIIRLADRAEGTIDHALDATQERRRGFLASVVDPYVNGVHVSLLPSSTPAPAEDPLAERCLAEGPFALSRKELEELLYQPRSMLHLHRSVWLRSVENIHPSWREAVNSYRSISGGVSVSNAVA